MSSSPAPAQVGTARINEIAYARALHSLFDAAGTFPDPPDRDSVRSWFDAWIPLEVSGIIALSSVLLTQLPSPL
jgi:hypothetical protein